MNESLSREIKKSSTYEKSKTLRKGIPKAVKSFKEQDENVQKLNILEEELKEIRMEK